MRTNFNFATLFRLENLVVGLALLIALYLVTFPISNFDIFWHISYGRAILDQGRILSEEVLSYTAAGKEFYNNRWLTQILFYIIHDLSGADGLLATKLLLVTLLGIVIIQTTVRMGGSRLAGALLFLVIILVGLTRYTVRPQLFSYLFLALLQLYLYRLTTGDLKKIYLVTLPLLMVIWDFSHGALFGLIMLTTFVGAETVKYLWQKRSDTVPARSIKFYWKLYLVTLAAMTLNPYGLLNYHHLLPTAGETQLMVRMTGEFAPLPFHRLYYPFLTLMALTFILQLLFIKKIDLTRVAIWLGFLVMALLYRRATAVAAIASLPLLIYNCRLLLDYLKNRSLKTEHLQVAALLLIIALGAVGQELYKKGSARTAYPFGFGLDPESHPIAATEFIREHNLTGNMYNEGRFGGYLAYQLYPDYRIFLYNQPPVYWELFNKLRRRDFIDEYQISYAIAEHNSSINSIYFPSSSWSLVYWGPTASVYLRNTPENSELINRYRYDLYRPGSPPLSSLRRTSMQNPLRARRLAREVAQQLSFARDLNLASTLKEILYENSDHFENSDALEIINLALRQNGESQHLWNIRGIFHSRAKEFRQALNSYQTALARDDSLYDAHLNIGLTYCDLGDYENARRTFSELKAKNENDEMIYYGLGLTALRSGNYTEARSHFTKFLELNPGGPWAVRARSFLQQLEQNRRQ